MISLVNKNLNKSNDFIVVSCRKDQKISKKNKISYSTNGDLQNYKSGTTTQLLILHSVALNYD